MKVSLLLWLLILGGPLLIFGPEAVKEGVKAVAKCDPWVLVSSGLVGAGASILYLKPKLTLGEMSAYGVTMALGCIFAFFFTDFAVAIAGQFVPASTEFGYMFAFLIGFGGKELPGLAFKVARREAKKRFDVDLPDDQKGGKNEAV